MTWLSKVIDDASHQVALMSPGLQMAAPAERESWGALVVGIAQRARPANEQAQQQICDLAGLIAKFPDVVEELLSAHRAHVASIKEWHVAALRKELERLDGSEG